MVGTPAMAQGPEALFSQTPGITWQGSSGSFVSTCLGFGFSCTPLPVAVQIGETATLTVSGEINMPYVLAVSTGANQCATIQGIENSLTLDSGILIVDIGVMTKFNAIAPCGSGMAQLTATIPAGIPPGTEMAFQAAAFGLSLQNFQITAQFITPLLLTF